MSALVQPKITPQHCKAQSQQGSLTAPSPLWDWLVPFEQLWAENTEFASYTNNSGAFTLTIQSPSWDFFEIHAPVSAVSESPGLPYQQIMESQKGLGWKGQQVTPGSNSSASDRVGNQ